MPSQQAQALPLLQDSCANLLLNGNMENDAGWQLNSGSLSSQYVSTAYSGSQSLLVGPSAAATEQQTLSTAWQSVTMPDNVSTLSFWYLPQSSPQAGNDRQYAGLVGPDGQIITLFLDVQEHSEEWRQLTADVSNYAGQLLWVYFGVENDGVGDASRMFVDQVTLCAEQTNAATTPATAEAATTALQTIPTPAPLAADNVYTFEQLGFGEAVLQGPYDSLSNRLGLPASWDLIEGATLDLHLTTLGASDNLAGTATLDVLFNNVQLTTTALRDGQDQTLTLPIPLAALAARRTGDRHELKLVLNSSESCDVDQTVNVMVRADSTMTLPYQTVPPATDLRLFPQPIFQKSFLPETAVLVVPDQPSSTNLQAAFTIAAGLGEISNSDLAVSLLTESQLTATVQETFPLIFVGLPETLPSLSQVAWPAPLTNGQFEVAEMRPDDGLLQMAVSPWNAGTAVLSVSGASEAGLLKAAQAVSQGIIRVGQQPDLAIVTAVGPLVAPTNATSIEKSLADLGYLNQEATGRGRTNLAYEFTVPSGYYVDGDAYIELVFSHSALLDYEQSGLTVRLNDHAIGSARFDESLTDLKRVQIAIPRSVVHTGVNQLVVRAEMIPYSACLDPAFDGIWMTLWSESRLFLPLVPVEGGVRQQLDLNDFPVPFDNEPMLNDVAFVVPQNDPAAWDTAVKVAVRLGDTSNSPIVQVATQFADQVSPEFLAEHHLIVVGLPTELPILADMQTVMPAPFASGSNFADEASMPVQYRLSADTSVGYLQFFASPWNQERAVLTVLGSTPQGVQWAGLALTSSELRGQLSANLAVVQDWQVVIGEPMVPQTSASGEQTAVTTPAVSTTAVSEDEAAPIEIPDTVPPQQASWMVPAMIGSGSLMGLIIIGAILSALWRGRRSGK
ncbi:MAG: cellulose biosynthesis cyclic di-GMP-binding regulatory protein BcsB [Anaerolineales bacterium]|nr:cellulose biosynthesis cyclic di-GMP-binding regulatory protein BcsB [Anaerolineales bacterium]